MIMQGNIPLKFINGEKNIKFAPAVARKKLKKAKHCALSAKWMAENEKEAIIRTCRWIRNKKCWQRRKLSGKKDGQRVYATTAKNQSSEAFTAKNIIKNTEQTKIGITENTRKKCGVLRMTREVTKADAIKHFKYGITHDIFSEPVISYAKLAIEALEKQMPKKVEFAIDHTWGTTRKQPVCPVCDYYLTMTEFIGDGEKITYCDHCGQAIDWSEEE